MGFCNAIDLTRRIPAFSRPRVNTLDIAARDRRARRLFGIRGFGRSEGNLGDFPAATSKKGKNVVAGYEGALDGEGWIRKRRWEGRGGKESVRVELGVWVSSKKPGSTTWWVGAMYQMFGLVRGAMDSGIDRIKACKKLFSIYRPTSAPVSSRPRCVSRAAEWEKFWNCDAQVIFPLSHPYWMWHRNGKFVRPKVSRFPKNCAGRIIF